MTRGPVLLTPGPLTTHRDTRRAMLRDWGSRDDAFITMTADLRRRLPKIAGAEQTHVAVPLQGSGTFAVEAAIATLVPRSGKLLVLVNGAYGERMVSIASRLGLTVAAERWAEDQAVEAARVDSLLAADPGITDVAVVHCETTSGLLNPLDAVASVVGRRGRRLLVDAMSSFGALPIGLGSGSSLMASSNKCLEGVPGIAFVLAERSAIAAAKGNCASLSLDLHEQWRGFEANGQWRFTPPVQVVAALVAALDRLDREGGPAARLRRYGENFDVLSTGMARLGFSPFLAPALQAPIIATFHAPREPWYDFAAFSEALADRGFVIYPGKLTRAESFRIGCIGALGAADMRRFVKAAQTALAGMRLLRRPVGVSEGHASARCSSGSRST